MPEKDPTSQPIAAGHTARHHRIHIPRASGFPVFAAILLLAVIIAWLIRLFVLQQYQVDGPSMQPTLYNGNRLIVMEASRTWARITGHPYIPKRGDIVIFTENNLYGSSVSEKLIKRVIGLPGDHIVINNGVITIYNRQHPKGFDPDKTLPYGSNPALANSLADTTCSGSYCNIVVPPNQVFVCGDHRDDSLDSRIFGTVPVKNIVGQLVLRVTPFNQVEKF